MATSNKDMADMMRKRRSDMSAMPSDTYSGPSSSGPNSSPEESGETAPDAETASENFTVAAPGEKPLGDQFEYEPFLDTPGAWVVYPPGVPCDDTQYRVQMSQPAQAGDFTKMQQALDDAGATAPQPSSAMDTPSLGTDQPRV